MPSSLQPGGGLGTRDGVVLGGRPLASILNGLLHFFSYWLLLRRSRTAIVRAGGFRLVVPPTVFHPRHFLTSEFFARFIARLDLAGKRVADVGTGSGILALTAARTGAVHVDAIDINPNAARAAAQNARENGLSKAVSAICSDLFSEVPAGLRYDVIVTNPPYFAGEPLDLADRAWHAGPAWRDMRPLFEQARSRLAPGGRIYMVISSRADLDLVTALISRADLHCHIVEQRANLIESFIIYELSPKQHGEAKNPN
ncbi:MAG: methyltransferase [Alphaproteobacteria bacterium]|nr:methyltransferase [Alphaproteobacteria bacterium]